MIFLLILLKINFVLHTEVAHELTQAFEKGYHSFIKEVRLKCAKSTIVVGSTYHSSLDYGKVCYRSLHARHQL